MEEVSAHLLDLVRRTSSQDAEIREGAEAEFYALKQREDAVLYFLNALKYKGSQEEIVHSTAFTALSEISKENFQKYRQYEVYGLKAAICLLLFRKESAAYNFIEKEYSLSTLDPVSSEKIMNQIFKLPTNTPDNISHILRCLSASIKVINKPIDFDPIYSFIRGLQQLSQNFTPDVWCGIMHLLKECIRNRKDFLVDCDLPLSICDGIISEINQAAALSDEERGIVGSVSSFLLELMNQIDSLKRRTQVDESLLRQMPDLKKAIFLKAFFILQIGAIKEIPNEKIGQPLLSIISEYIDDSPSEISECAPDIAAICIPLAEILDDECHEIEENPLTFYIDFFECPLSAINLRANAIGIISKLIRLDYSDIIAELLRQTPTKEGVLRLLAEAAKAPDTPIFNDLIIQHYANACQQYMQSQSIIMLCSIIFLRIRAFPLFSDSEQFFNNYIFPHAGNDNPIFLNLAADYLAAAAKAGKEIPTEMIFSILDNYSFCNFDSIYAILAPIIRSGKKSLEIQPYKEFIVQRIDDILTESDIDTSEEKKEEKKRNDGESRKELCSRLLSLIIRFHPDLLPNEEAATLLTKIVQDTESEMRNYMSTLFKRVLSSESYSFSEFATILIEPLEKDPSEMSANIEDITHSLLYPFKHCPQKFYSDEAVYRRILFAFVNAISQHNTVSTHTYSIEGENCEFMPLDGIAVYCSGAIISRLIQLKILKQEELIQIEANMEAYNQSSDLNGANIVAIADITASIMIIDGPVSVWAARQWRRRLCDSCIVKEEEQVWHMLALEKVEEKERQMLIERMKDQNKPPLFSQEETENIILEEVLSFSMFP